MVVDTGSQTIGFEIKFSSAPKVTKGFWQACEDIGVSKAYVVAPVQDGWAMANNVDVVSPVNLPALLRQNSGKPMINAAKGKTP